MLTQRTPNQIINESVSVIKGSTDITNFNPGSVVSALINSTAIEILRLQTEIIASSNVGFLDTATGRHLDLIGNMFNLPRRASSAAFVSSSDRNIRISTVDGTPIANYIPSKIISSGTRISNASESVVFLTDKAYTVNDVQAFVYVGAVALSTGTSQNIGAGLLTTHDLGNANITVTNESPITTGNGSETDESYRFRLSRAVLVLQACNAASIETSLAILPGVSLVTIVQGKRGVGTIDVLLLPSGNRVPSESLRLASVFAEAVKAAGMHVKVREPEYIAYSTDISITFTAKVSNADKQRISRQVQRNVLQYISEIGLGGLFVVNELRQRVMQTDDNILDMRILCLKIDQERVLIANYKLLEDQLFVPDDRTSTPINVMWA